MTEAIARAVDLNYTDEEIQNIVQLYGNDIEGLLNWYSECDIIISQPVVLKE